MFVNVDYHTFVVCRWHPSYNLDEIKRMTIQYPIKWIYDRQGHVDPNMHFTLADLNSTDKMKPIVHETGFNTDMFIDDLRPMMRYLQDLRARGILPFFVSGTLIPYKYKQ